MVDEVTPDSAPAVLQNFRETASEPAGLMIQGLPGRPMQVVYANPAACLHLGVPKVDLHLPPLDWSALPPAVAAYLTEAFEAFPWDDHGGLPVLELSQPVKSAFSVKTAHRTATLDGKEVRWFYFTFTDVTVWLSLQEEVMDSRRLESIGALASGVAHDFNNLLMVIRGHADFIAAAAPHDDTVAHSVDQIRRACQSGSGLTQSLLGFARKQSLAMQPMNIGQLVAEVADLCHRTYGARYEVVLDPSLAADAAPRNPHFSIHGCAAALSHCLLNILNNARDSMPNGGRIHITQHCVNDTVRISIADQGVGIEPRDLRHIFEPFFTTKKKGAGTGLGLALALSIMKQHGGDIRIESTLGQGTTVTFIWPQLPADKNAPEPSSAAPATPGPVDVPLLAYLIDDDDMVRTAVAQLLKLSGIHAERFARAEDALARIHAGEMPSLILVDYTMPGMDGITFMREIIRLLSSDANPPPIKLVLISGHPPEFFDDFIREFHGLSIYLLQKPFSAEDVNRILRAAPKKIIRRTTTRIGLSPGLLGKGRKS